MREILNCKTLRIVLRKEIAKQIKKFKIQKMKNISKLFWRIDFTRV